MGNTTYLFTVTKVANTDRYIIRSVLDQTRTLCVSGSYVIWTHISEDDSQVSESNTFNIININGTYRIKDVLTNFIYSVTKRKPMILPIIMEV